MKHRKLRIAWSVAWGVVAVLLCVLWVRSYWWMDDVQRAFRPVIVSVTSDSGKVRMYYAVRPDPNATFRGWTYQCAAATDSARKHEWAQLSFFGFSYQDFFGDQIVIVSYWHLVTVAAIVAGLPWLRWRFNLRTLLIAMTLIAVALGMIVWSMRQSVDG